MSGHGHGGTGTSGWQRLCRRIGAVLAEEPLVVGGIMEVVERAGTGRRVLKTTSKRLWSAWQYSRRPSAIIDNVSGFVAAKARASALMAAFLAKRAATSRGCAKKKKKKSGLFFLRAQHFPLSRTRCSSCLNRVISSSAAHLSAHHAPHFFCRVCAYFSAPLFRGGIAGSVSGVMNGGVAKSNGGDSKDKAISRK